jgi:hypothetical protein
MNPAWKEVQKNWLIQLITKFVVLFVIASVAVIVWRWNRMPPQIPLWYSRPWGADELAAPIWLFLLPIGSLAIFFINLLISMYVTAEYLIFTQVLFIASFIVNFLSFITLIKIIFIIT